MCDPDNHRIAAGGGHVYRIENSSPGSVFGVPLGGGSPLRLASTCQCSIAANETHVFRASDETIGTSRIPRIER